MKIELKILKETLAVCKVKDLNGFDMSRETYFIGKTDEELSLVCSESAIPDNATHTDKGWRAMKIQGILDFSLIGILSKISGILADNKIGIFVVSTYNTDYILVKGEALSDAERVLKEQGYTFV